MSVTSGGRGLAVANRGLPEHEVIQDDNGNAVIALTLLRCVGWLSRPDLLARKGNGGWTLPTPARSARGACLRVLDHPARRIVEGRGHPQSLRTSSPCPALVFGTAAQAASEGRLTALRAASTGRKSS